jgi:predicted GIY-YIG superfamily endonuclease
MSWYVYLLATVEAPCKTYVGATIDVDRRLAQHNGLQSGGARATSTVPGGWYRVCYIKGFPDKREALRFEWWWKRRSALFIKKCAKTSEQMCAKTSEQKGAKTSEQKGAKTSEQKGAKGKLGPLERRQAALEAMLVEAGPHLEVVYE